MSYGAAQYGRVEYAGVGDNETLLASVYDIESIIEDMLRELECNVNPGSGKGIQVVTP